MITVNIRRQGGAAVITIPADMLKMLDLAVGEVLELDVKNGTLLARPMHKNQHKRYSWAELLRGVTPKVAAAMKAETETFREGEALGRELL